MSLMLFGQSEPEPTPEVPIPDTRRRYLIIFATVIALILGAGSAAFLLLNSGPKANHTAPNAYTPPNDGTSTDRPADETSASPSPSPTSSPSHSPSPSRSPSAKPSAPATGVTYRVNPGSLCPSVDFSAPARNFGPASGMPIDEHTDKSNYVDYICQETFNGKVKARVDAMIFSTAAAASTSYYVDTKSSAPTGSEAIGGIGQDAFGYVALTTGYTVYALDGNLVLRIFMSSPGGVPTPGRLRDEGIVPAAKGTLGKLPRA